MPLAISFELSDRDLEHFNKAIKAAREAAGQQGSRRGDQRREPSCSRRPARSNCPTSSPSAWTDSTR